MIVRVHDGLAPVGGVPIAFIVLVPVHVFRAAGVSMQMRVGEVRVPVSAIVVTLQLSPTAVRDP